MSSIRITQVRSTIGQTDPHMGTLRALGLGKIGRTAEHEDTPQLRGMLRHVNHLVLIERNEEGAEEEGKEEEGKDE